MIARAMRIDPYAFRLQNVVQEGDVSGTGQVFRPVRGEETLRRAAEAARWEAPKPGPYFGRGIALGQRPQGRAVSIARVAVDAQGRATLLSSVPDTGVGFYSVGRHHAQSG
jgi:CO/xanthine dehydrogenase Mo-binding subunit